MGKQWSYGGNCLGLTHIGFISKEIKLFEIIKITFLIRVKKTNQLKYDPNRYSSRNYTQIPTVWVLELNRPKVIKVGDRDASSCFAAYLSEF